MSSPLLSIIVPVYNSEEWLNNCIESILSQSFTDFELILVDDGSKDSSGDICDKYDDLDERVKVLHIANGGVSNARNRGIEESTGKLITFIDSDDWISPGYLEAFDLKNAEYDICYQGIQYVYEDGSTEPLFSYQKTEINKENLNLADIEKNRLLFDGCPVAKVFSSCIINKYALRFDPSICMHEDHVFVFDFLLHANVIACVSNVGYNYRRGLNESLSSKIHSSESLFKASDLLRNRIQLIYNNGLLRKGELYDELLTHYGFSQRLRAILNLYLLRYDHKFRKSIIQREKKDKNSMKFFKRNFKCSNLSRKIFIKCFCYLPVEVFDSILWLMTYRKKI